MFWGKVVMSGRVPNVPLVTPVDPLSHFPPAHVGNTTPTVRLVQLHVFRDLALTRSNRSYHGPGLGAEKCSTGSPQGLTVVQIVFCLNSYKTKHETSSLLVERRAVSISLPVPGLPSRGIKSNGLSYFTKCGKTCPATAHMIDPRCSQHR